MSTPIIQILVSNIIPHYKETGFLKEMADSRVGVRQGPNESRTSYSASSAKEAKGGERGGERERER